MNLVPYMRSLQRRDVTFTVTWRLLSVVRDGNKLRATLGSDYGDMTRERLVDQVVVNHGTRPLDELYFDLKPLSRNGGEVDYEALTAGRSQAVVTQSGRPLPPLPHRRRRRRPQHPCRNLRRAAADEGPVRSCS